MIKLKGIGLQYIVGFEEAYLNMTEQMTVITGLNKDSRISLKQNNASGKSTLVSAFPSALYEASPVGKGKDRASGMTSKDSCIQLDLIDNEGKEFCVQQRKTRYYLSDNVDGDLKAYNLSEAKKLILERFPLTEEEFYTYVYIHGSRPFDFRFGSPTNQFSFIAKLFRLDVYDQLKNVFRKRRDDCAKAKILYDAIQDNITKLQLDLKKVNWDIQKNKSLAKLERKEKQLSDQLQKLLKDQSAYELARKKQKQYKQLTSKLKKLKRELQKLDSGNLDSSQLEECLKRATIWEEYIDAKAEYSSKSKKLKARIVEGDISDVRARHSALAKKADKLDELAEQYEEAKAEIKELKQSIRNLKRVKVSKNRQHWETVEANALYVLELEELKGEKECPTCRRDLDPKMLNRMLAQAKSELKEARSKLKQLDINAEIVEAKSSIKELSKIKFNPKELEALDEEIQNLEDEYSRLKDSDVAKELLSELVKPKKPKTKRPEKKSEFYETVLDVLDGIEQIKDRLSYLGDVDSDLKDLSSTIAGKQKSWKSCREEFVSLSVSKTQYDSLKEQLTNAYASAKKQLAKVELFEKYDFLFKQYGGPLKQSAIDNVLMQLQNILNANADLVFVESLKFSFEVKNNTIISTVSRNYGKPFKLSKLSDSEGECFRLLFAYALASLVPDTLRVDTIILDEPDKACDDVLKEHIVKNFIPVLQKLIPNVVWVTPKNSDVFSDCRHLTVIKEDGQSRLERT